MLTWKWAEISAPPKRRQELMQKGDWVLEWDPEEHKTDQNPGWGPCAGSCHCVYICMLFICYIIHILCLY